MKQMGNFKSGGPGGGFVRIYLLYKDLAKSIVNLNVLM